MATIQRLVLSPVTNLVCLRINTPAITFAILIHISNISYIVRQSFNLDISFKTAAMKGSPVFFTFTKMIDKRDKLLSSGRTESNGISTANTFGPCFQQHSAFMKITTQLSDKLQISIKHCLKCLQLRYFPELNKKGGCRLTAPPCVPSFLYLREEITMKPVS